MSYKRSFGLYDRIFKFDSIKQAIYSDMKADTIVNINSKNRFNRERIGGNNQFDTYDEYLVKMNITDVDSVQDRIERCEYDPLINAWVSRSSEEIFRPGFTFKDEEGKQELRNPTTKKIHSAFEDYNLIDALIQARKLWLAHGWSFITQFWRGQDNFYRVYSQETLTNYLSSQLNYPGDILKDEFGFPIAIKVPKYPGDTVGVVVREPNFIFINIGAVQDNAFPDTHLRTVWNQAINFVESLHSQKNFMCYFALIPFMRVPMNTSDAEQDQMKAKIQYTRFGNRALVARGKKDDIDFELKGGASIMPDFPANLMAMMQAFATPTGYPVRWFVGDPKGALEAASQDDIVVVKKHEGEFARWRKVIKQIITKFVKIDEGFKYSLESNLKERETDKDKWEKEKLKAEAIKTGDWRKWNEMRIADGLEPDPKYEDKYYLEVVAEMTNPMMGINVTGLENKEKNENNPDNPKQFPNKPQPKALPTPKPKQDSFIESFDSISIHEHMRSTNSGKQTVKKWVEYIHDIANDAITEDQIAIFSFNTDSMIENDEYYVIDSHIFDGTAKLQYIIDSEISIERNPPEEIEKWVVKNKNKQFVLGVEHEMNAAMVTDPVGYIMPVDYNKVASQDISKAYIRKDALAKYPDLQQLVKSKSNIELSGAYRQKSIISKQEGFHRDHVDLDLYNVVMTAAGRCGKSCAITPSWTPGRLI